MTSLSAATSFGKAKIAVIGDAQVAVTFFFTYRRRELVGWAEFQASGGSWTVVGSSASFEDTGKAAPGALPLVESEARVALAGVDQEALGAALCERSANKTTELADLAAKRVAAVAELERLDGTISYHEAARALAETGRGDVLITGMQLIDGGFRGSAADLVAIAETLRPETAG